MTVRRWSSLSTRARWLTVLLVVVVLAVTAVAAGRWQRSDGHRAHQLADSVGTMPGVTSSGFEGDDHLVVRMRATVQRAAFDDVYDRVIKLPQDLVSDVSLTVGSATAEIDSGERPDPALMWALRSLTSGQAQFDGRGANKVFVERGHRGVVGVAREAAEALAVRGFARDVTLYVGHDHDAALTVNDEMALPIAGRVLDELAPVARWVTGGRLSDRSVAVQVSRQGEDHTTEVAKAAQRGSRVLRADGATDPTFWIDTANVEMSLSGTPDTDLKAPQRVKNALSAEHWEVSRVSGNLSSIDIGGVTGTTAVRLPQLDRDLRALRPALPRTTVVRVKGSERTSDLFSGTVAELGRVARTLAGLERDGYLVSWQAGDGSVDIGVALPKGSVVDEKSIRALAPRLRGVGWSGSAAIVIQQRERDDGEQLTAPYVNLVSTADGRVTKVTTTDTAEPRISDARARSAWDESAAH